MMNEARYMFDDPVLSNVELSRLKKLAEGKLTICRDTLYGAFLVDDNINGKLWHPDLSGYPYGTFNISHTQSSELAIENKISGEISLLNPQFLRQIAGFARTNIIINSGHIIRVGKNTIDRKEFSFRQLSEIVEQHLSGVKTELSGSPVGLIKTSKEFVNAYVTVVFFKREDRPKNWIAGAAHLSDSGLIIPTVVDRPFILKTS